jgi:lipopolysaccharide transport system ATP-binding protein
MTPIIQVVDVSKKFRLGSARRQNDSLREALIEGARASWRALRFGLSRQNGAAGQEWIWALKDVNFSVEPGEVVGIIGANGAGKSTLLKILSRITDPTEGYLRLGGRVASLLEVGTGFHPDLTGRENVYMNGVMLGMSKAEIQSKFDEIVAFSELQKFIDTPVKHYSSGMYVRLGFAVAAHLQPDILIVDEVLAVGDMAFQKKCLGKMGQFGETGRTILFVSHSIPAVLNLCKKGIVLELGTLSFLGDAKAAVHYYMNKVSRTDSEPKTHVVDLWHARGRASQYQQPWLCKLEIYNGDGTPFEGEVDIGTSLRFRLEFFLHRATADFDPRIHFVDAYGQFVFSARSSYEPNSNWGVRSGVQEFVCEIPGLPLTPGEYRIEVGLVVDDKAVDYVEFARDLKVRESDFYKTGKVPSLGFFVHEQHWELK